MMFTMMMMMMSTLIAEEWMSSLIILLSTTTTITSITTRQQEDEKNVLLYGFENDSPDLEADQLDSIRAIPVESFSPTKHCNLMDFLR